MSILNQQVRAFGLFDKFFKGSAKEVEPEPKVEVENDKEPEQELEMEEKYEDIEKELAEAEVFYDVESDAHLDEATMTKIE